MAEALYRWRTLLCGNTMAAMNVKEVVGLPFADRVLHYATLDATRLAAARMAERGACETTLITADYQTQGRGTQGRIWYAPPGGSLLVSILTRPIPQVRFEELAGILAEALAECVRETSGLETQVKPPNDVHVHGKKLGGVLAETAGAHRNPRWILSFGLNCSITDFPPDLGQPATSLAMETDAVPSREALLAAFLIRLGNRLGAGKAGQNRIGRCQA